MDMRMAIYGKLPAHSDYVLLNLPAVMETTLHQWSVEMLAKTEQVLGHDQWLNAFLQAEPCVCVLQAGCPDAVSFYGVMIPSVDRVGRYFPLFSGVCISKSVAPEHLDKQTMTSAMAAILEEQVRALHGRKQVETLCNALSERAEIIALANMMDANSVTHDGDSSLRSWWYELDHPERLCRVEGMPPVEYYQSILTKGPVSNA